MKNTNKLTDLVQYIFIKQNVDIGHFETVKKNKLMCKINQKNKTHKQKKNRQRATACLIENEMSNVDVRPRTYFNYQVNHNILIQINIWFQKL